MFQYKKDLKSWEYAKKVFACLLIWKRLMTITEYLQRNFGGYFRNMAVVVSCWGLSSHFTVNQKYVFV